MPTDTFQIGNGKTAKVGDKVWDASGPDVQVTVITDVYAHNGRTGFPIPMTARGGHLPEELFRTRAEAFQYRIQRKLTYIAKAQMGISNARAEVARLESMLASEGDGAKGSAA